MLPSSLTADGARSRFRARLSASSAQRFHQISLSRSPGGTVESRWPEGLHLERSNETRHHPGPEPARYVGSGGKLEPRRPAKGPSVSDEGARFFTTRNYEPRIRGEFILSVAALALERRLANPSWFALPSVSGFRLVPSEQAPRFWARAFARAPGSGSPVPAEAGRINDERPGSHKKNPPEQRSGGSVGTDFRSHIRRDRSHESRWRSRTAHGRSDFRLSGRIGTAWSNSHQASGTIPERWRFSSWFGFDCQQPIKEVTISPRCRARV